MNFDLLTFVLALAVFLSAPLASFGQPVGGEINPGDPAAQQGRAESNSDQPLKNERHKNKEKKKKTKKKEKPGKRGEAGTDVAPASGTPPQKRDETGAPDTGQHKQTQDANKSGTGY